MYFLMYIAIAIAVYVVTFKDDFTEEHIQKVTPFITIIVLLFLAIGILGSLVGRG